MVVLPGGTNTFENTVKPISKELRRAALSVLAISSSMKKSLRLIHGGYAGLSVHTLLGPSVFQTFLEKPAALGGLMQHYLRLPPARSYQQGTFLTNYALATRCFFKGPP